MNLRREATQTIWKTVVFAGAMLGSACASKTAPVTTTPEPAEVTAPTEQDPCGPDQQVNPCSPSQDADPCADPCGRARGVSDEGSTGRGFILS